jgi:hypothetical protein
VEEIVVGPEISVLKNHLVQIELSTGSDDYDAVAYVIAQ